MGDFYEEIRREVAFSLVFEYMFTKAFNEMELEQFDKNNLTDEDFDFIKKLYKGVVGEYSDLENRVGELSKGFKIERDVQGGQGGAYDGYFRAGQSRYAQKRSHQRGGGACQKVFHGVFRQFRERCARSIRKGLKKNKERIDLWLRFWTEKRCRSALWTNTRLVSKK